MMYSSLLLLSLSSGTSAFIAKSNVPSTSELHVARMDPATSFQTIMEFNREFNQGLQVALDPKLSSDITAVPSSSLQTTMENVHQVLAEAHALTSSTSTVAYQNQAVIEKTIQDWAQSMTEHPFEMPTPQYVEVPPVDLSTLLPFHGAPPGQGLATPLVDFVLDTLYSARDVQYGAIEALKIQELPADYQLVDYGFQVKNTAIEAAKLVGLTQEQSRSFIGRTYNWMVDESKVSWQMSAPLRKDLVTNWGPFASSVHDKLYSNYDTFTGKYGPIAAGIVSRTVDGFGLLEDNVRNRLNGNYELLKAGYGPLKARFVEGSTPSMADIQSGLSSSYDSFASWQSVNGLEAAVSVQKFEEVRGQLLGLVQSSGSFSDMIQSLNMRDVGGWSAGMVVGFLFVSAFQQRSSADPPKAAASPSKPSVQQSKPSAQQPVVQPAATNGNIDPNEKEMLEGMVVELTQAVAILTTELKDLKTKRAQSDYDLATMKSNFRTVKNEVDRTSSKEQALTTKLESLMSQNNALQEQLEAARGEADTLQVVNDVMNAEISMTDSSEVAMNKVSPKPPSTPPPGYTVPGDGTTEIFFASIAEKQTNGSAANSAAATNGSAAPKPVKKSGGEDDWSNLSLSALKRKPLTELAAYLQKKGASITDANGNMLKKADLLREVLALEGA